MPALKVLQATEVRRAFLQPSHDDVCEPPVLDAAVDVTRDGPSGVYSLRMLRVAPHADVLVELVEWWEDVAESGVHSQAVILPVPHSWGRTTILSDFADTVAASTTIGELVRIDGLQAPDGRGLQAWWLGAQLLNQVRIHSSMLELLGFGRPSAAAQQGLGVAGLFVAPPVAAELLIASTGVGAAARLWDQSAAGEQGQLARAAAAVARLSVSLPMALVLDNADRLDPSVALVMIESLVDRHNGQVLVVATTSPESPLLSELRSRARYGLTQGRVHTVDVDPAMGYSQRVDLAKQLHPGLPAGAAERISQRTTTFTDVFAVASADRLTEFNGSDDEPGVLAVIDQLVNARAHRPAPSFAAVIIGWAGGMLHAQQAERALEAVNGGPLGPDEHLVLAGSLIRLLDPAAPEIHGATVTLSLAHRRAIAEAVLDQAELINRATDSSIVDRVVAARAAHLVRDDISDTGRLLKVQVRLTLNLEQLGDLGAALTIAKAALHDTSQVPVGRHSQDARGALEAAMIRLSASAPHEDDDPLVRAAITRAMAGGAAVGLEARVWAAVNLLSQPGKRQAGLRLTDTIARELQARDDLGPTADSWRLLLAFHAGRAEHPQTAQHLLAPLLIGPAPDARSDTARQVLFAVAGPGADTRLQLILLQADLNETPHDAIEDRLRLHHALGAGYARLGDYPQALIHAKQEYPLRAARQGAAHPHTLDTRSNIAGWTGECGEAGQALRLFQDLLPEQERVLGQNHPDTLITRHNIAGWTGQCGDDRKALRLYRALLPDQQRVLGRDHPNTMSTRNNIAFRTGQCGDDREALRLFQELLSDRRRISGPDHPDTLIIRNNVASWTGECGDAGQALLLFQELLSDRRRVSGPDHPNSLITRHNIAFWTSRCGDAKEALRLYRELLPDQQRVLGPDHPKALNTRNNIAFCTGKCGDAEEALRLYRELLPDQQRVSGPDHPDTLNIRNNFAFWTSQCGDARETLRLYRELLPDQLRVLGPEHPDILNTRNNIAYWTRKTGDAK